MPTYRLYCLDKGKITQGDWLEAADEATAIEAARVHSPGVDCELWLGKRLIAKLPVSGDPIIVEQ